MKRILILLSAVVLYNCTTEKQDDLLDVVSQEKVNQVNHAKSKSEQRLLYSVLSPNEKRHIWVTKFDNLIENKKSEFDNQQIDLLIKLRDTIDNSNLFDNSDEAIYFKSISFPEIIKALNRRFTTKQLKRILYEVKNFPSSNKRLMTRSGVVNKDKRIEEYVSSRCNCARGGVLINDCGELEMCVYDCSEETQYCGYLWMQNCVGTCQFDRDRLGPENPFPSPRPKVPNGPNSPRRRDLPPILIEDPDFPIYPVIPKDLFPDSTDEDGKEGQDEEEEWDGSQPEN